MPNRTPEQQRGRDAEYREQYIKRYEADDLVTDAIKDYEREVVQPRHEETQKSIGEVKELIQQGAGVMKAAGALLGLASATWICIQIVTALATHK